MLKNFIALICKLFNIHIWGNFPIRIQHKISCLSYYFGKQSWSKSFLPLFCRLNYQDSFQIKQFIPSNGGDKFQNFNDFFIRKYRILPSLISKYMWPCNGFLCDYGKISGYNKIQIKENILNITSIFSENNDVPSTYYFSNIFLHNRDYHRIHSPVDGNITRIERIAGDLIMLRPWFYPMSPSYPAMRNERVNIDIVTDEGQKWFLSIIGGLGVRTVQLTDKIKIGTKIHVGNEIAVFLMGSTCCMASPIKSYNKQQGDQVTIFDAYGPEY